MKLAMKIFVVIMMIVLAALDKNLAKNYQVAGGIRLIVLVLLVVVILKIVKLVVDKILVKLW